MNPKDKNEMSKGKSKPQTSSYKPYDDPYSQHMDCEYPAQFHRMPQHQHHYQQQYPQQNHYQQQYQYHEQHQQQEQMTLGEMAAIQEVLYYLKAAYTRCIDACIEMRDSLKMKEGVTRVALLKLNGLIDNASIQFTAGAQRFPKEHMPILQENLTDMQKDFKNFVNEAPLEADFAHKKEIVNELKFSFERFFKVLNLESVPLTPVSRKEVDPSILLGPVNAYYAEINKSEKDLAALKENRKIDMDKPKSSWK